MLYAGVMYDTAYSGMAGAFVIASNRCEPLTAGAFTVPDMFQNALRHDPLERYRRRSALVPNLQVHATFNYQ